MDPIVTQIGKDLREVKQTVFSETNRRQLDYSQTLNEERGHTTERSHAIIVSPNCDKLTADDIEKEIKTKIRLAPLGIAVNRMKKIKHNKLLIICPAKQDAELLSRIINEKFCDNYKAELLKKRWPRILIKNLSKDYSLDDICEDMRGQNQSLFGEDTDHNQVTIKKVIQLKNNDTEVHVLVEVPCMRRRMQNHRKLNLGYQRLNILDEDPLIQCYHCLKVGHMANRCMDMSAPPKCSTCGGPHNFGTCDKRQTPRCVNCSRENNIFKKNFKCDHSAVDRHKCEYLKKMCKIVKEKIEY
jgi:hypothetical protein